MSELVSKTVAVVGASRGLGRGIAAAFADAGAAVVAVARTTDGLRELTAEHKGVRIESADATDPATAVRILRTHSPDVLVLVAGATPHMAPLQEQTWETFSVNWETDTRLTFHWLQQALLRPLRPGSRVIVISSGAALAGSPLSGGYAGAKATQRFITGYAQDEADRAGLGITFTTVLPRITPLTGVGAPAARAYAKRSGMTEGEYLAQLGELLTPAAAGKAMVRLAENDVDSLAAGYLLTGAGLHASP